MEIYTMRYLSTLHSLCLQLQTQQHVHTVITIYFKMRNNKLINSIFSFPQLTTIYECLPFIEITKSTNDGVIWNILYTWQVDRKNTIFWTLPGLVFSTFCKNLFYFFNLFFKLLIFSFYRCRYFYIPFFCFCISIIFLTS